MSGNNGAHPGAVTAGAHAAASVLADWLQAKRTPKVDSKDRTQAQLLYWQIAFIRRSMVVSTAARFA